MAFEIVKPTTLRGSTPGQDQGESITTIKQEDESNKQPEVHNEERIDWLGKLDALAESFCTSSAATLETIRLNMNSTIDGNNRLNDNMREGLQRIESLLRNVLEA
jgi:hypothetical protein